MKHWLTDGAAPVTYSRNANGDGDGDPYEWAKGDGGTSGEGYYFSDSYGPVNDEGQFINTLSGDGSGPGQPDYGNQKGNGFGCGSSVAWSEDGDGMCDSENVWPEDNFQTTIHHDLRADAMNVLLHILQGYKL